MNTFLIYAMPLLFTIAFVIYSKYQFEDMKATYTTAKRKWHPYGAFMRVMFFVGIIAEHFYPSNLWDILVSALINIILWDILLNIIALHVQWNYVGTTAATDRKLGKIKWYAYAGMLISATIITILNKHKKQKP